MMVVVKIIMKICDDANVNIYPTLHYIKKCNQAGTDVSLKSKTRKCNVKGHSFSTLTFIFTFNFN